MPLKPGSVRDAIIAYLSKQKKTGASVSDIHGAVVETLGQDVPTSSVRSYLNLNTPKVFERLSVGHYRLKG